MARAASRASSKAARVEPGLHTFFFLDPLVIEHGDYGAAIFVESILRDSGAFEVRRGAYAALQQRDASLNCSGTVSPASDRQAQPASALARRIQCSSAYSLVSHYETFHVLGLHYGPAYRLLLRAWEGTQCQCKTLRKTTVEQLRHRHALALNLEVLVYPA